MKIGSIVKVWFSSPNTLMLDIGSIEKIDETTIQYLSMKDGMRRVCLKEEVIKIFDEGLGE